MVYWSYSHTSVYYLKKLTQKDPASKLLGKQLILVISDQVDCLGSLFSESAEKYQQEVEGGWQEEDNLGSVHFVRIEQVEHT